MMIAAISGANSYGNYYLYGGIHRTSASQASASEETGQAQETQAMSRADVSLTLRKAADPDTPVQPVDAAAVVKADASNGVADTIPFLRQGADPVEMAVRMRIQEYQPDEESVLSADGTAELARNGENAESAQEIMEEGECQTCEKRKYQDGSDDPGVSFKTAAHIAPEQAASTVRSHEMEHVSREQAKAEREGREVVSQTVTLHTGVCPECGKVYVSGGTTRTVTAASYSTGLENEDGTIYSAVA